MLVRDLKLMFRFPKALFSRVGRFFYDNLQVRDQKKALPYTYSGKNVNAFLKTEREVEKSLQNLKKIEA